MSWAPQDNNLVTGRRSFTTIGQSDAANTCRSYKSKDGLRKGQRSRDLTDAISDVFFQELKSVTECCKESDSQRRSLTKYKKL